MFENSRSAQRAPGREHVPLYPKGFIAIRIVQLVIAVIILGLIAYSMSLIIFDGNCLNIFTAIATIIISIYYIVAEFGAVNLYNYWAVMSLDIFMVIFWIASFALLASEVAPFMDGYCDYYYCYSLSGTDLILASCLAAAAGLGGLEFALFCISLIIHSIMMHRHRKAGLHCNPGAASSGVAPSSVPTSSVQQPVQAEKPNVMPSYTVVPQQQPAVYMQQQTPAGYPQQTMTPPPQQVYGSPVAQPTPYYPQQTPSPLVAQQTGPYTAPQQGVPAPQPGHYEAQGTQVPQQYHQ